MHHVAGHPSNEDRLLEIRMHFFGRTNINALGPRARAAHRIICNDLFLEPSRQQDGVHNFETLKSLKHIKQKQAAQRRRVNFEQQGDTTRHFRHKTSDTTRYFRHIKTAHHFITVNDISPKTTCFYSQHTTSTKHKKTRAPQHKDTKNATTRCSRVDKSCPKTLVRILL